MATYDTRLNRARRRGRETVRRLVAELAQARRVSGVSQTDLARSLGRTQADISRFERLVDVDRVSFTLVAEIASLLGLELGSGLHRLGDAVNDRGHQALIGRFRAVLSVAWRVLAEVPLP